MRRGKKPSRRPPQRAADHRIKITPASILGLIIGLVMIGIGLFSAMLRKEYGGYYVVALGVAFTVVVCWGIIRKR